MTHSCPFEAWRVVRTSFCKQVSHADLQQVGDVLANRPLLAFAIGQLLRPSLGKRFRQEFSHLVDHVFRPPLLPTALLRWQRKGQMRCVHLAKTRGLLQGLLGIDVQTIRAVGSQVQIDALLDLFRTFVSRQAAIAFGNLLKV